MAQRVPPGGWPKQKKKKKKKKKTGYPFFFCSTGTGRGA
jgi:hypothetical protein